MTTGTGHDFWSRRKAGVEAEDRAERTAVEMAEHQRAELVLAEKTDEELLAELDLPDPDTLETSAQVQDFLKAAVPQRLKNRALRRLWLTNPVLANVDGLVDYGEDFTDAAMVIPDMQTVYKVGRGMIERFETPDTDDEADEAEEMASDDTADTAGPEVEDPALVAAPVAEIPQAAPYVDPLSDETDPDPLPAASRRMQFSFKAVS